MAEWNEHVLKVRAGLDKASKEEMLRAVKEVFTEGAVVDFSNKQNLKELQEFANAMQKIFAKVGSTKDFSKMIKLPGPEMFAELKQTVVELESLIGSMASSFGDAGSAFGDGIVGGIKDATKQVEAEFDRLIKTQMAKEDELEKLRAQRRRKRDAENRLDFDPYDVKPAKVDKNFAKSVSDIMEEYYDVSEKLENAIDSKTVTEPLLQQWIDVAKKLSSIRATIHDIGSDEALKILKRGDVNFFTGKQFEAAISQGTEAIEEFIDPGDINAKIDEVKVTLAELNTQIADMAASHPELISRKDVVETEQRLKSIQEAYDRLFVTRGSKKGEISSKKLQDIEKALNYKGKGGKVSGLSNEATVEQLSKHKEAIKVAQNALESAFSAYGNSVGGDWEDRSRYLIKAIAEYESILNNPNIDNAILEGYRSTYEEIKKQEAAEREKLNTLLMMGKTQGDNAGAEINPKDIVDAAKKARDYADEELKIKQAALEVDKQAAELAEKIRVENEGAAEAKNRERAAMLDILTSPAVSNSSNDTAISDSSSGAEKTSGVLTQQNDLLSNIQKLTTYIDDEYLSAGKHLSDFLDDIQAESAELDTELKEILTTLNLVDESGKSTFTIKRNGEDGGGTTHNGALISDKFVLIERDDFESVKDSTMPGATQNAAKAGMNVAEVLGYIGSKYTGGYFDVQSTATGHNLFEDGVLSQDVVNATDEQLEQLTQAFIQARDHGFNIENGGSNIVYDKEKGFSFYDLEEMSGDDASFWNSLSDSEKKLTALEDLFSLFSGLNRDHTNFDTDPNVSSFTERLKQLVLDRGIISPDATDKIGRNFEDIYDDVFSGDIDAESDDIIARLMAEAEAHKKNAESIKEETNAQIELNNIKNQNTGSDGGVGSGTGDVSYAELEEERARAESLQSELYQKNSELVEKNNEIQRVQSEKDAAIQAANAEKEVLQNELKAAQQLNSNVRRELLDTRDDWVMAEQRASAAEEKVTQLEQRLADASVGEQQGSLGTEELINRLSQIIDNVKIAYDDNDKKANKIALDEGALENVLRRVFADIRKPDDEQGQSEPSNAPWALENTLLSVKEVLGVISTNTSKPDSIEVAPAKTDVGNVLATESTLAAIKTAVETISKKTRIGAAASKSAQPENRFATPNRKSFNDKDAQDLIKAYETQGKLRARLESDGDVEAKAQLQVLAEEVARKRESLQLTADEITALREKSKIAYEAEKKLISASKQKKQASKEEKASLQAAKKQLADDKKLKKRQAMTGKAGSAIGRGESVWLDAEDLDKSKLPDEFKKQIKEQRDALDDLILKLHEVNTAKEVSDQQVKDLRAQTSALNDKTEAVGRLVAEYQKLSGDNVDEAMSRATVLGKGSSLDDYKNQMAAYVREVTNGKGSIKDFNSETKTLTYTVKTGSHEFTEYTVAVRNLDHQMVSVQGTTKRTETFFEATARKMRELTSYFSGMAVFNRVRQELQRGIQYVREIDDALTELRKVTEETSETYDKFLKTAAKTGEKLGATISDVTRATATFAKLGYDISLASEMAEAALVYMNVGDGIESADEAANSIISTMKGFGLATSESMRIVDSFNQVGNEFSVTSKGLGDALQRSAAALNAAGNTLDESIGLISAANTVINDPDSVGVALKTLALRIRGAKTELSEAGLETENMADTTAKLQQKLLALTHGSVDIMLDANTFKSTTQIIRELSEAWKSMTDVERAAATELLAGQRQSNVLSALIQNFDIAEDAIKASANSAGK